MCQHSSTEVQTLNLDSYFLSFYFVHLLRSQFVYYLSHLAFQNKKFVEQSNIVLGLLFGVFIFVSVYELFN